MRKTILAITSILILGACSVKPFLDSRREVGKIETIGDAKKDRPVFCYNPYSTSKDELFNLAQKECNKHNKIAVKVRDKKFVCSMTAPHKVYFECIDK